MKLLRTPAVPNNPTILKAMAGLAVKPTRELNLAFMPSAMHLTEGDKTRFTNEVEGWH